MQNKTEDKTERKSDVNRLNVKLSTAIDITISVSKRLSKYVKLKPNFNAGKSKATRLHH